MDSTRAAGRGSAAYAVAAAAAAGLGLVAGLAGTVAGERLPLLRERGSDPGELVLGLAAAALALLCGWLLLSLLLTAAAGLPGALGRAAGRSRDALTPLVVRRWAALAVGLAAPVGVAVPAAATVATATESGEGTKGAAAPTLDRPGFVVTDERDESVQETRADRPGWTPQQPTTRSRAQADLVSGRAPDEPSGEVVVRRGDSLWSVTARALGPGATDLDIAAAWPLWYDANRDVIGDDPDLIHPGTRLRAPADVEAAR